MKMEKLMVAMMLICLAGCSKESRDETIDRLCKAGKALNGEVRSDDKKHATPNIVYDQQRKERVRQNTKWTAENQANTQKSIVRQCLSRWAKTLNNA